jgi:N-acetylneuraminate synthase
MSTGVSRLSDLDESVRLLRSKGCKDLVLLKCTSTYPATPENTNLITIPHLASMFNTVVGLSDHTLGVGVSVASIALGARVIEKHFTLSRADGGVDSTFSLEPAELKSLVTEVERAFLALGRIQYGVQEAEKPSLKFKRSLYFCESIAAGTVITNDHVKALRPGNGIETKYLQLILGKKVNRDVQAGTPVQWELF